MLMMTITEAAEGQSDDEGELESHTYRNSYKH
jgi:hypothetical protein